MEIDQETNKASGPKYKGNADPQNKFNASEKVQESWYQKNKRDYRKPI